MTGLEAVATVLGITSVVLLVRQNVWCWPTGIVMVTLYVFIFYKAKLYSDMGLQVYYIFMQAYGWVHWVRGGNDQGDLPVTRLTPRANLTWLAVCAAGTAGLGHMMDTHTDAELAYWDASTTVMSLVAQYLQARKVLECWLLWIAVDVLAIGIYFAKDLVITTGLYSVFLGLATWGFLEWRRSMRS